MQLRRVLLVVFLILALVVLVTCSVQILGFTGPAEVGLGQVFELRVTGKVAKGTGGTYMNRVGCVLQVPKAVTLQKWALSDPGYILQKLDEPALLQLYKAEAGMRLYAFSSSGTSFGFSTAPVLTITLMAPLTPGSLTLKVAAAGEDGSPVGWVRQSPPAVSDFAKITKAPHVLKVTVKSNPTLAFLTPEVNGLPWPNAGNWGGVAFGDVTGNGRQELACVARLGKGPKVYAAQPFLGGVTWTKISAGLSTTAGRGDVAFGDFNGDGHLDVACTNGRVLLNNGRGGFTATDIGSGGEGIAVGDVNGDGYDDVAFTGHLTDIAKFFFSNGKGGFTESSKGLPTGGSGGGHNALLKDFNGDGKLDLLWNRGLSKGGTEVWAGDGKGTWKALGLRFGTAAGPSSSWGVVMADVDNDGKKELVFGVHQLDINSMGGGVRIWKQTGPAKWVEMTGTGLPNIKIGADVAAVDFDGDGNVDIAAGLQDTGTASWSLALFKGNGKGAFTAWPNNGGLPKTVSGRPEGLETGDFDGDGWPDLAVAIYGGGVIAYRNTGTGFHVFGRGCKGALKTRPQLVSSGVAKVNSLNFGLGIASGSPGKSCGLYFGLSRVSWDMSSLGASGCVIQMAPLFAVGAVLDSSGRASVALPIPNAPTLYRVLVFAQGMVQDQAANKMGLLLTPGGSIRIGK